VRTLYWYFTFGFTLLMKIPQYYMVDTSSASDIHRVTAGWAKGCLRRAGVTLHVEGTENVPRDEAVVFVANHQGNFDIPTMMATLPVPHGYIAKIETLKIPVVRDWMRYMKCVFIDRKNIRQTAKALLEGIEILKGGHSLVLFPEGTRSKSSTMGEFKPASFKLATKAKAPIVPVSISGTFRVMETNNSKIKPADVYVKIHPAIRTDDLEDLPGLPERVKAVIASALPPARP